MVDLLNFFNFFFFNFLKSKNNFTFIIEFLNSSSQSSVKSKFTVGSLLFTCLQFSHLPIGKRFLETLKMIMFKDIHMCFEIDYFINLQKLRNIH